MGGATIVARRMAPPRTPDDVREVNARYHDVAAREYDRKWGIDFDALGSSQVLGKVRKALGGRDVDRFGRALEIGAGTGYFALNLLRAGIVESVVCTDISPGMLTALKGNAERLEVADRVQTVACDAEALPFADQSFDLVCGHAVLHHLPELAGAFSEFRRVLRPGGTLLFAGEPSRHGDRIAAVPKRTAARLAPLWRRALRARPADHAAGEPDSAAAADHALEPFVDVHTFTPAQLSALARDAGFESVEVTGEELLANWFGWTNRTLEASADPESVPWLWRQYAYRGYLALQALDAAVLEPRLPPAVFYNLLLSARRP
jgi:ubiquinone/menaquinone biosynthesis C-methylase UbiE